MKFKEIKPGMAIHCQKEEELPPHGAKKIPTEEILRKYTADHDGNYYAVHERRCRVKGE